MERFTISKSEKQTIFEIYRACRLCGAGGGYRMPIIQNIVDLDSSDVELRQKIQDCLQLEVRQDDRMPPLICELCVDKINDFYKFLELTRQTNIRTRTRLGLPLQTPRKGEPDPGDCILGVTEPLCVEEPLPKKSKPGPKCSKNIKKEVETDNIKAEASSPSPRDSRSSSVSSRSSRAGKRAVTPPQPTRGQSTRSVAAKVAQVPQERLTRQKEVKEKEIKEKEVKDKEAKRAKPISKKELNDLLQDSVKYDDNSLLVPRSFKRTRETEIPKPAIIPKRTKPTPKEPIKVPVRVPTPPPPPPPPPKRKPGPKSAQEPKNIPVPLKIPKPKAKVMPVTPPKEEPPKVFNCTVCNVQLKTVQALTNHTKFHLPNYTKPQNACNPCGMWFVTTEEANSHHRYHRSPTFPYHCRRCFEDYDTLRQYNEHIDNGQCTPWDIIPDVRCDHCWKTFPTENLKGAHKCPGVDGRPGGKCSKCPKTYATLKSLKKHESTCNQRRKRDLIADPDVLRRLKPMQVRMARCDDLLSATGGRHDVSNVKPNHGLDKHYHYPYITFKMVKSEPLISNSMVAIHSPIKGEFERDGYTHWDSEDSDNDNVMKKVDSLSILSIKRLFSKNLLGKLPRKRKRVKNEAFDSTNDFGNMSSNINNIISSLGDDLESDCLRRSNNVTLMASLNDIIGVPDGSMFNDSDLEIENHDVTRKKCDYVKDSENTLKGESKTLNLNDNLCKDSDDVINSENTINGESETSNENDNLSRDSGNVNDSENMSNGKSQISNINDNLSKKGDDGKDIENTLNGDSETSNANFSLRKDHLNDMEINNGNLNETIHSVNGASTTLGIVNKENDTNIEEANDIEKLSHSKETNNPEVEINHLNTENDEETEKVIRIENDNVKKIENSGRTLENSNSVEHETELAAEAVTPQKERNSTVNGIYNHDDEIGCIKNVDDDKTNHDCNETESKKSVEVNIVNKESPIKHSIDNLIGDTDRNPDKYINEVISSIENIIMKNPRSDDRSNERFNGEMTKVNDDNDLDDQKLMDALNAHIGEDKDRIENDKITLEDLLPKGDRSMDLDEISDNDFDFDA